MKINSSAWNAFVTALGKLDSKATEQVMAFINESGWEFGDDTQAIIKYAYGISTKYGEAAASLACEMYDSVAAASKVNVPAAVPASTATYGEVAKAINGTAKTMNAGVMSASVGRLVKTAGVDTTMQNALRDGAEWAWVPHGDTCAFCLTLASRGWQKASVKAIKNGHAEHIHPNCDCTYAIRFDSSTDVEGYEPEKYKRIYMDADGSSSKEKINSMRREFYAMNKTNGIADSVASAEELNLIPQFIPAKSIGEAEEFASQYIQGGSYSSVDYSGVDLEYANEFNRAMNDVLSQYEPKYKLRDVKPMNTRSKRFKGTTADAAYQWGSNDLFFNKGYFKSQKDFAKHLGQYRELLDQVLSNVDTLLEKYSAQTGFAAGKQRAYLEALKITGRTNVSMADPYKTMVHELGHYLDDTLFRSAMKQSGFDLKESCAKFATGISAYATTDTQEYVAESFLSYFTGETESLDPALVKIFEVLKK